MIFDLHIHETTFSYDSQIYLVDIVREAKRKGLDGICITDHDSNGLVEMADKVSKELKLPIIVGNEILTFDGDILVFGIDEFPKEKVSAQELIDWVNQRGGATIAAHPFRNNNRGLENTLYDVSGLTAIESYNGRTPDEENEHGKRVAEDLFIPTTGGSDAHLIYEVGQVATKFYIQINSDVDLVRALKSGQYEPVVYMSGRYVVTDDKEVAITA